MTPDPALLAAYSATEYRFCDADTIFCLRVGTPNPEVDAWLSEHGCNTGAFISNCNPRAQRLSDKANTQRTSALQRWLTRRGLRYLIGLGVPPADQDWVAEASFFLPDTSHAEAEKIAQHCEQLAWVWHAAGKHTQLIWTQLQPT